MWREIGRLAGGRAEDLHGDEVVESVKASVKTDKAHLIKMEKERFSIADSMQLGSGLPCFWMFLMSRNWNKRCEILGHF